MNGRFGVSVCGEDGAFGCVLGGGKEGTIGDPGDAQPGIGRRYA